MRSSVSDASLPSRVAGKGVAISEPSHKLVLPIPASAATVDASNASPAEKAPTRDREDLLGLRTRRRTPSGPRRTRTYSESRAACASAGSMRPHSTSSVRLRASSSRLIAPERGAGPGLRLRGALGSELLLSLGLRASAAATFALVRDVCPAFSCALLPGCARKASQSISTRVASPPPLAGQAHLEPERVAVGAEVVQGQIENIRAAGNVVAAADRLGGEHDRGAGFAGPRTAQPFEQSHTPDPNANALTVTRQVGATSVLRRVATHGDQDDLVGVWPVWEPGLDPGLHSSRLRASSATTSASPSARPARRLSLTTSPG